MHRSLASARPWPLAVLLALLLALIAWPAPAAAQGTFVCPNGPGPGERQVGMTGGGNGVASVPVCVSDGSGGGYAPAPVAMRAIDNYYAAAWHAQSNDAWIAAGHSSRERAAQTALAACNRAMGQGCTLADSNVNGTIAIGRGVTGGLYSVSRAKKAQAEKALLDYCRKQNDECIVINSVSMRPGSAPVGSAVNDYSELFAPRGNPRRQFGAIAWVDAKQLAGKPWTGDVWAVTGKDTAEAASSAALANCQRDLGSPCLVALSGSDVFIAISERDGQSVSAASGPTTEIANRRSLADCRKVKGKCRIATTFTLAQDWAGRFDPFAQGKPYFSAQAWPKGAASVVWSMAGAKSEAEATKAVLDACNREAKQTCEIAANGFNGLTVIFADNKSNTHVLPVARDADPAAQAQQYCARTGVTCRIVKVIDARAGGLERLPIL